MKERDYKDGGQTEPTLLPPKICLTARRVAPSLQPLLSSAPGVLHGLLWRGENLHFVAHLLGLQDAVAVVETQHVCGRTPALACERVVNWLAKKQSGSS